MGRQSLVNLTAIDVMKRDVVVVEENDGLADAMRLMAENHVSGLPVVDADCRCIGVISASDILNLEQQDAELKSARYFDPDSERWESVPVTAVNLDELPKVAVSNVMSRDVLFVDPGTPLVEVAQRILDRNVHRILVLDDHGHVRGVISAMDIVRLWVSSVV